SVITAGTRISFPIRLASWLTVGLLSRAAHAEPESRGDRPMCAGMPEYMPGGAGTDRAMPAGTAARVMPWRTTRPNTCARPGAEGDAHADLARPLAHREGTTP